MDIKEANRIYESWRNYMEIAEKLGILFTQIPESLLPYPVETLEEALNIMRKAFGDSGDIEAIKNIEGTMGFHLSGFYFNKSLGGPTHRRTTDEEAMESMAQTLDLYLQNPDLKKIKLEKLRECQNAWIKFRNQK
ncbi:MAG: hypothetical protein Q8P07_02815 [bacterium]|nr:hypothetical protein [bacterium]